LRARLQVNVSQGQRLTGHVFETIDAIMTVGAYRPLDDCLAIAFPELVA